MNCLDEIIIKIISETNGISLSDTLELANHSQLVKEDPDTSKLITEFRTLLCSFLQEEIPILSLLAHPIGLSLFNFFKHFPLPYQEEHIHLTGSLSADFVYPRLKKLLEGPNKEAIRKKIIATYGEKALPINSAADVDRLIRLKDDEHFERYLKILLLPKMILATRQDHMNAAYHMASELHAKYNIGRIRIKFSIERNYNKSEDFIPGLENLKRDDVILGLYDGFEKFKKEYPEFSYILSPSFRKESHYYDSSKFVDKKAFFNDQAQYLIKLLERKPELIGILQDIDTVGDEKELYRKGHFEIMRLGLRKLQYQGLKIRSHHGEIWHTLKKGVQAVDNAMNIWHIDTLEHGLSLGINPNYFFHMLFERVMEMNNKHQAIAKHSSEYKELCEMDWKSDHMSIRDKIITGKKLNNDEVKIFIKTKFHTAREIEHYQHDILNRMIDKNISLIALPSSNKRLTGCFPDFYNHPFSWWEKKGVRLGVGTDNYITLGTNFIREMLILLFTDASALKITKLLMVTTGETRRPFISQMLWKMREGN